jgi:ribose-phosphate pyrophosphokinase
VLLGGSQVGKAPDFESGIRRFESFPPSSKGRTSEREVKDEIKIVAGNSNPRLAAEICDYVGVQASRADVGQFSDGEVQVEIRANVRGGDVFVIQSTCTPTNDNLMELLLMLDALKRASAKRITAVMPYYGYARQDRKVAPRVPISAKLVADLITTAGASRLLTVDLHAGQIQGFFNIPVDNLYAAPAILQYLRTRVEGRDVVIVSPDAGGVERARAFAKRLDANLAIIDKRRVRANEVADMQIIGDVRGRTAVIIDDMVDTAGTLCRAAQAVRDAGAAQVLACATHPVLSGPAVSRIAESALDELIVTDTIPLRPDAAALKKIKVLPIATLLGEAIRRTHHEDSISSLFV